MVAEQRVQALWDLAGKTRPAKVFAYPYGHFTSNTVSTLQTLGYDAAFTTIGKAVHSAADRLTLGRFGYTE